MSNELNPPVVTPNPVREPASEWASSTLDALGPASHVENRFEHASSPTTPGLQVPGAFPGPYPTNNIAQDTQHVKNATISALQAAKGYVPTSVEDVKRLLQNTGDTVGGYLPESIAGYLPDTSRNYEKNSQNVCSARSGGEGTNPATTSPPPPEETPQNIHPNSTGRSCTPTGHPDIAIPSGECISSPTSKNHRQNLETFHSETGIAILPEERRQKHLPSHDDDPTFATETGESVSTGGVGALPGDKKEAGVAVLPEERFINGSSTDASTRSLRGVPSNGPDTASTVTKQYRDVSHFTLPTSGSASLTHCSTGTPNEMAVSSTQESHPIIPNTSARMYPLASDGVKFKGVPLSKGLQKELDEEQPPPAEKSLTERRNLEQGQNDVEGHDTSRKKPGFMDKLKGEVKVISGKLSHKESKVEEGKRMMGKTLW